MKVSTVVAESSTVAITLEAEHSAEVALVNLMGQCSAECEVLAGTASTPEEPKLRITIQIKKARGY